MATDHSSHEQQPSQTTTVGNSTIQSTSPDTNSTTTPVAPNVHVAEQPNRSIQDEKKTQPAKAKDAENDPGLTFLSWLRQGITSRSFEVNSVNTRVHMMPEGMLLVSPAIFKDFDRESWELVQKRLTKLRLHQRRPNIAKLFESCIAEKPFDLIATFIALVGQSQMQT